MNVSALRSHSYSILLLQDGFSLYCSSLCNHHSRNSLALECESLNAHLQHHNRAMEFIKSVRRRYRRLGLL